MLYTCIYHAVRYFKFVVVFSYSMMGINIDGGDSIGKEAGIIPRFCHELFERIASLDNSDVGTGKSTSSNAKVEISYFEIYNEKIHDLLGQSCDGGKHTPLKVREHPVFGPYVVDLSAHGVTSYTDLQVCFQKSSCLRTHIFLGLLAKFDLCTLWCCLHKIFGKKDLIIITNELIASTA
jgi:kinesin family protein 14